MFADLLQQRTMARWAERLPRFETVLTAALVALIVALQVPMWFGKGSWSRVWELDRQLATARAANADKLVRNLALDAEVRDLKDGIEAVEERARLELGMIKPDEVLYRYR
jgi:cell division protein FtsB